MRTFFLFAMLACSKSEATGPDPASVKKTELAVKKYAFEAYPEWAAAHPDKECPAALTELDQYMGKDAGKDAWGNTYTMYCGKDLPAGARGLAVASPGPDGKLGTADDIQSWK
jgi:hypothetical protein